MEARVQELLNHLDASYEDIKNITKDIDFLNDDKVTSKYATLVAIGLAKNYVASSAYKKQKINISSDSVEIDFPSYENPENSLMHLESLNRIKSYVDSLPESLRTAFTLREVDGKSYEEIANITNTPIGTVRSRIFRAREGVLEYIAEEL